MRFDRRENQSTVASPEAHPAVAPPEEPVLQIPDPNDDLFPNLGNPDPIPDVDVDALIEAAYDNIHFAIEQIHLFHNFLHYFVTFIS